MQNTPAELCERVFYCAIISRLFDDLHRAVVIAMVAVLMMQTTVYQVIHMVAVWHGFVSAACAVAVFAASVHGVAAVWVGIVYFQAVFIIMLGVGVVQMPIVQVIHMVAMLDGGVSAVCAVGVCVVSVGLAIGHGVCSCVGLVENGLPAHCKRLPRKINNALKFRCFYFDIA